MRLRFRELIVIHDLYISLHLLFLLFLQFCVSCSFPSVKRRELLWLRYPNPSSFLCMCIITNEYMVGYVKPSALLSISLQQNKAYITYFSYQYSYLTSHRLTKLLKDTKRNSSAAFFL